MKKSNTVNFSVTAALFALFVIFTVIIKTVDVAAIGPLGSSVGLSSLNGSVANALGASELWYNVSEILGIVALLTVAAFGLLGVTRLIKRRSLFAVDPYIILLAAFYLTVAACYLFFEVVEINFRPILSEGELEASYPSSHTMLICTVMGSAVIAVKRVFEDIRLRIVCCSAAVVTVLLTVIGRTLSGVHWFTDIIGGVILSAALVMLYHSIVALVESRTAGAKANK